MQIFLIYPNSCNTVLRTFVCSKFEDADGGLTYWLADDPLVECDGSTDVRYALVRMYAVVMIFIVIVGMPLVLYRILWHWRFPINMLYECSEEGRWTPAPDAMAAVGGLYGQFKEFWAFGTVDMIRRLLLTSLIKVIFAESVRATLLLSMIVSGAFALFFSYYQPYAYREGNYLAAAASIAMVPIYAGKLPAPFPTGDSDNDSFVEMLWLRNLLLALMIAPLVVGTIMLFHFDDLFYTCSVRLQRRLFGDGPLNKTPAVVGDSDAQGAVPVSQGSTGNGTDNGTGNSSPRSSPRNLVRALHTTAMSRRRHLLPHELTAAVKATSRTGVAASDDLAKHQRRVAALCTIHKEMLQLALSTLRKLSLGPKSATVGDEVTQTPATTDVYAAVSQFNDTVRQVCVVARN